MDSKKVVVYKAMNYYSALKKKEILLFMSVTTWINSESIMLKEICQMEKDRYCVESLICEI